MNYESTYSELILISSQNTKAQNVHFSSKNCFAQLKEIWHWDCSPFLLKRKTTQAKRMRNSNVSRRLFQTNLNPTIPHLLQISTVVPQSSNVIVIVLSSKNPKLFSLLQHPPNKYASVSVKAERLPSCVMWQLHHMTTVTSSRDTVMRQCNARPPPLGWANPSRLTPLPQGWPPL